MYNVRMSKLIKWDGYLEKEQLLKLEGYKKRNLIKGSTAYHVRQAIDIYLERLKAQFKES